MGGKKDLRKNFRQVEIIYLRAACRIDGMMETERTVYTNFNKTSTYMEGAT